jgi:hypothetical protein
MRGPQARPAVLVRSHPRTTNKTRKGGTTFHKSGSAVTIKPGEEIHLGAGRRFRVLDVVMFEEEDESPFVGLLQVEAAQHLRETMPRL